MAVLLAVIGVLDLAVTSALFIKLCIPSAAERTDAKAQRGMHQPPEEQNPIDEGFENIMRFEVNGATGFEGDRKWPI